MNGPTKLNEERIYHVGDTVTLEKTVRLVGNLANTTTAGFTLNLPIKIGSDVTGLTLTDAGNTALKVSITKDTILTHSIGGNQYYCDGVIISHEFGMMNIVYHFPAVSANYAGCMALLALSGSDPAVITFT